MNPGQRMEQFENIQQPEKHWDDYNAVQNGFDGPSALGESVHQPQEDTYNNQNFENWE